MALNKNANEEIGKKFISTENPCKMQFKVSEFECTTAFQKSLNQIEIQREKCKTKELTFLTVNKRKNKVKSI